MSFLDNILTQPAKSLATLTGTVAINTTDPGVGHCLKVTVAPTPTAAGVATWQLITSVATALASAGADINVSAATPVAGRYLRLFDLTHAEWGALPVASGAQDGLLTAAGFTVIAAAAAHIASAANPHATTKAQVGLTNVTDDAQLKRANNDWSGYTPITVPTLSDNLLSEIAAGGAKGTLSLSALTALIKQQLRDPIWDAPTTSLPDSDEFTADTFASGAWTATLSSGAVMVRDGAVDPTVACASGHYRSSMVGGVLIVQIRQNESVFFHKQVAAALSSNQIWTLGIGMPTEPGTASANNPVVSLGLYRQNGAFLDFSNRSLVRTGSSLERIESLAVVAGAPVTQSTNSFTLVPMDGLAVRIDHGSAAAGNMCAFGFRRAGVLTGFLQNNGVQFNLSTDRVGINLFSNSAGTLTGANNALFTLHHLRRIPANNPGFLAQA